MRSADASDRDPAARLGVKQPRTRDLYRGQIGRFRADAPVLMLLRAGVEVSVTTKHAKAA